MPRQCISIKLGDLTKALCANTNHSEPDDSHQLHYARSFFAPFIPCVILLLLINRPPNPRTAGPPSRQSCAPRGRFAPPPGVLVLLGNHRPTSCASGRIVLLVSCS